MTDKTVEDIPLAHRADISQAAYEFVAQHSARMQLGDQRIVGEDLEKLLENVYLKGMTHDEKR